MLHFQISLVRFTMLFSWKRLVKMPYDFQEFLEKWWQRPWLSRLARRTRTAGCQSTELLSRIFAERPENLSNGKGEGGASTQLSTQCTWVEWTTSWGKWCYKYVMLPNKQTKRLTYTRTRDCIHLPQWRQLTIGLYYKPPCLFQY